MTHHPVRSSAIATVGYDALTATLEIRFHSGRHYRYFLVPPHCYQGLLGAESKGRFFLRNIRPAGYPYQRLDTSPSLHAG